MQRQSWSCSSKRGDVDVDPTWFLQDILQYVHVDLLVRLQHGRLEVRVLEDVPDC